MSTGIILEQILVLVILALIGVIATRRKIIHGEIKTGLSKIVFNVTLPFLIITRISSLEIDKSEFLDWGIVIILVFTSILFFLVIGTITARILKLPPEKSIIHTMHTAFTNAVFLGFPILDALFPNGEGILYGIIYFLTQNTTMWTLGIYMFTREEKRKKLDNLKNLINPNTIAFFIGIMLLLLNIQIPAFLFGPLEGLGKTTIYLAMLYTGSILAYINIKSIVRDVTSFYLSFNKLILAPLLFLLVIKGIFLILPIDLNSTAKTVIVLEAAMPCQTLMIILARQFNKDDFYATQNFSISTLLSIITLPIIYYITQLAF